MQYERKQSDDEAPQKQVHLLVFGRPAKGAWHGERLYAARWFLDGSRKKPMILLGGRNSTASDVVDDARREDRG